jgi:hypothetical protein
MTKPVGAFRDYVKALATRNQNHANGNSPFGSQSKARGLYIFVVYLSWLVIYFTKTFNNSRKYNVEWKDDL